MHAIEIIANKVRELLLGGPGHVMECAAGEAHLSQALKFWGDAKKITLVEPRPEAVATLRVAARGLPNLRVIESAIAERDGTVSLMYRHADRSDGSTYVQGVLSPERVIFRTEYQHTKEVPGKRFDTFDDGTIDYLIADTEGYEWHILQNMLSRPRVITIEMAWEGYRNPHQDQIETWLADNGYALAMKILGDWTYERS